jgi:transcriptional regulator with XRE-family HTH domain
MSAMRLKDRYEALSVEQRERLAERAEISAGFLYQLATRFKGKKPSIDVLSRLAKADKKLTVADMVEEFADQPTKAAA